MGKRIYGGVNIEKGCTASKQVDAVQSFLGLENINKFSILGIRICVKNCVEITKRLLTNKMDRYTIQLN